jgi:hypothetical protein
MHADRLARALRPARLPAPVVPLRPDSQPMTPPKPRQVFIQGLTKDGRTFRPSDWSERLAGAMSCFRPGGTVGGISGAIGYSPYCVPRVINGVKCVIVSEELKDVEPMAWDFVMNFARDNELQVAEACWMDNEPRLPGP